MSERKEWRVGSHNGSTNVFQGKGNEMSLVAECGTPKQAHLIAAAPDLLEALETILTEFAEGRVTVGTMTDARVAVAKAKGETND